jgi:hypothetical protein
MGGLRNEGIVKQIDSLLSMLQPASLIAGRITKHNQHQPSNNFEKGRSHETSEILALSTAAAHSIGVHSGICTRKRGTDGNHH